MRDPKFRKHRAFTLVELLVCLAIIAIIGAIVVPAVSSAYGESHRTKCAANLRELHAGTNLFALDNHGIILPQFGGPNSGGAIWSDLLITYLNNMAQWKSSYGERPVGVYACPSSDAVINGGSRADYGITHYTNQYLNDPETGSRVSGNLKMRQVEEPARTVLFMDSINPNNGECCRSVVASADLGFWGGDFSHNGTANVVFFDGHVEAWQSDKFPAESGSGGRIPWAIRPID